MHPSVNIMYLCSLSSCLFFHIFSFHILSFLFTNDSTESYIAGLVNYDDLMVFHQAFVTKEPVNVHSLYRTLLLNYALASALAYILRNAA